MTKARQRERAKRRKAHARGPLYLIHLLDDSKTKAWCGATFGPRHKIAVREEQTTCAACRKLAREEKQEKRKTAE